MCGRSRVVKWHWSLVTRGLVAHEVVVQCHVGYDEDTKTGKRRGERGGREERRFEGEGEREQQRSMY